MGNRGLKELICTIHGHELRVGRCWRVGYAGSGGRGKIGKTVIAKSINIFLKIKNKKLICLGFWFILISFLYMGTNSSLFYYFAYCFQFSQHHLLKRLYFFHFMFLAPLLKITCPYTCGFFSGFSTLLYWSVCLFFCQYLLLGLLSLCCIIWSQGVW